MFSIDPTNIYDVIKPVLYFSKILSTAPYKILQDGSVIIHKKTKWFEFFLYLSFIIAEVYMQIFTVSTNNRRSAYEWLGAFTAALFLSTNFVSCIQMIKKHESVSKILKEIKNMNEVIIFKKNDLKKLWIRAISGILAIILLIIALIIATSIRMSQRAFSPLNILLLLHVVRLYATPVVMEFHFVCFVMLLEHYINWIHKELKNLNRHERKKESNEVYFMKKQ